MDNTDMTDKQKDNTDMTDKQIDNTDMTKQITAFNNSANAPKNLS